MATSTRPKTAGTRTAEAALPGAAASDATLDGALDRWSDATAREFAAFGLGAMTTLLRSMQAVQEAQLEAAREVRKVHEELAASVGSVHGFADLARLQMSLMQADGKVALESFNRLGAIASRQALEMLGDTTSGWAQLGQSTWAAALQALNGVALPSASPELFQAEVEHVVNPFNASPLVWPAQEVARQAMTLAGSAWNDWLTWSNQVAEAGQGTLSNGAGVR